MTKETEFRGLIEKLVSFRTVSDNANELERCVDFICSYFEGTPAIVKRFESNGKPSVVVTVKDTKSPEILIAAHLDVVPAEESMFKPIMKDGKLYARGALDCKAQVAILMLLIREFCTLPNPPNMGIMLTSDEEIGGKDGVQYLLGKAGYICKFAIVADGGKNLEIVTKHKALLHLKLSAIGKAAHGSTPWEGENAADILIDAYQKIRANFPSVAELKAGEKWRATLNLGMISSGDAVNRVPDKAEFLLDIRYTENESEKSILEKVRSCLGKGINVEIICSAPLVNMPLDNSYLKLLEKAEEKVLGRPANVSVEHGSTDARYFSEKKIPAAIIWSVGSGAHSSNENVELGSVSKLYEILKIFILSCNV